MRRRSLLDLGTILMPAAMLLGVSTPALAYDGYTRDPSIGAGTIVFSAEQTIWSVPEAGGSARHLTTRRSTDPHPVISPDGKWIAFAASYDGPTEIYVMPTSGGEPRRATFENTVVQPLGWDGKGEVLYTAPADSGAGAWSRVVTAVDPQRLVRRVFPLSDANDAVLDPDGRTIWFIRFGLGVTGDHVRAYRGGAMAQLWRFNLQGGTEAQRIGPQTANIRRPMRWRDRLIVVSDADGRDQLWSLALDGSDPRQLTHHANFGIRSAALSGDRVVYQLGADIRTFDLATLADTQVPIDLTSDQDARLPHWIDNPLGFMTSAALSPGGDQVVVTARGHVAVAARGSRRRVDLAAAPGTRLREAVMSADGRSVFAIADTTGEDEIWRYPADGSGPGTALTHDGITRRWAIFPSPDGKFIAHDDKRGRLWLLDLASGGNRLVDDGGQDGSTDYSDVVWSRDGKALAFVRHGATNLRRRLALLTAANGHVDWLTDDRYESFSPAFSPDGHWLWFLSDRSFTLKNDAPWGDRNTGPVFEDRTRIYALALQPGLRFPFQPHDELTPKDPPKDKDGANPDAPRALPSIDGNGLADRLYEVPHPAGPYAHLATNGEYLFLLSGPAEPPGKASLLSIHIDDQEAKTETFAEKVKAFDISADGRSLFLDLSAKPSTPAGGSELDDRLLIVPAGAKQPGDVSHDAVEVGGWRLRVDPVAEWHEEFFDAWRLHRDYFYDQHLRGVDWAGVRRRLEPLLDRLGDRADLDDLLGQMTNELGALHSQVRGADPQTRPDADLVAGLGAHFEHVADGWRVAHIYRSPPDLPSERAPLQAPGVGVREGDVITAIDGQPTVGIRDPGELLGGQAGRQVLLMIRRAGIPDRRVVVVAEDAKHEALLRYRDWEQGRAEIVRREGGGRIGYLHLRAMGPDDIADFARDFYANVDKDGLVIDVRRNRGGNIDSWVIEKLLRRPWMFWQRYDAHPQVNMQDSFRGHLVVLVDPLTYSDGETFSAGIKALRLAPLIGERTAGAGVWLSDDNLLLDKGHARAAQNPQFDLQGHWLVENQGVAPDEVVENMPVASFHGQDQQLEAGLKRLREELAAEPVPALVPEALPALPR